MWKTTTVLIVVTMVLVTFGIVMLASTSGIRALALNNDPYFYVKRQVVWIVLAFIAGALVSRLDYHRWSDLAPFLFLGTVLLLILVLVPEVGLRIGGSRRWLAMGPLRFQPSELGKFVLLVTLAAWMSNERRRAGDFVRGALVPVGLMGVIVLLIFAEPDYGTALLAGVAGMSIMLLGGTKLIHLAVFALPGLAAFAYAVMHNPVRRIRILAFMEPELYAQTYSFQLMNALYAFTLGGGGGVGLGQSMQKQYYLPEAHTDFIFAIVGEEMGAGATIGVLLLFAIFFFCGFKISVRAPDVFGRLLGLGITLMITLQAMINIGVVSGCLPTKGLALPFISYGGSCLLMLSIGLGVLLNIGEQGPARYAEDDIRGIRNRFQDL